MTTVRSIFAAALAVLALQTQAHATEIDTIYIDNTTMVDLNVPKPSLSISVSYPGEAISGICGLEIRSDSFNRSRSIGYLLREISIVSEVADALAVTIKNDMTILVDLRGVSNGYLARFRLQSKIGTNLDSVVQSVLGDNRKLVMVAVGCR